jgi:AcrR family transcriptional regulator
MAEYVKVEQRRALARAAALRVLARGDLGPESLALRHVAQEMDVPLSTLTYAYPSTSVLFEDLVEDYTQQMWDGLSANVGDGGLRVELHAAARSFFVDVLSRPARQALILWQVQALARHSWGRAEVNVGRATVLVDTIAQRAAEHYRVPHEVLANLIVAFTTGQVVHWVATGDERSYWSTVLAGVDGTVLLADPRPRSEPHPQPAPLDYANAPLPDVT